MPTLDLAELQADACENKIPCMSDRQLMVAWVQLLIDSLGGTVDMPTLMEDACANGLDCMSDRQLRIIGTQLLLNASLSGGVTYGTSNPTTAPPGNGGVYYRTDTGQVWIWNPVGLTWDLIIS